MNFSVPERVRFRYRLEGVDSDWQNAGTRREAFYTNLPPGKYHFQVIACNEEGTTVTGLVRIELATGNVTTIVTGTTSCDPTRRTPWGTIIFGEEDGQEGRTYELIDPIHTTNVTLDRDAGTFTV